MPVPHGSISFVLPLQLPPFLAGTRTVLDRECFPSPQDNEHSDHTDHGDKRQSVGRNVSVISGVVFSVPVGSSSSSLVMVVQVRPSSFSVIVLGQVHT